MKIAVTATGRALDASVEARFGRCAYFLIIDTDTMQFEAMENPNLALGGGAGIQSAQLMSEKGVKTVLTGNCGPNAFNVFGRAGIQVIVGVSGSVRHAVEQFKAGALSSASSPNVASHFGMGRGGGMGMGRAMKMAGATGMLPTNPDIQNGPLQELTELKQQAQMLERQKQELDQRINQIAKGYQAVALIDPKKCTGCGICVSMCPANAIELNEYAVVDDQLCTGCGACVSQCPTQAIAMTHCIS
jgi:predicted Fe-Mo cluster-binding NifX family protein/NAD-dependent dihydropyrimidine dehydrogenase PreA subunit